MADMRIVKALAPLATAAELYTSTVALCRDGGPRAVHIEKLLIRAREPAVLRAIVEHYYDRVAADLDGDALGGAGQPRVADKALEPVSRPSEPPSGAAGQRLCADKATKVVPGAEGPDRRRPGHARRGLAAVAAVQPALTRSLFDSTRLPDGRALREVRWGECPGLARRYRHLSRVLLLVHQHATPPDAATTLDAVVSEAELAAILQQTERLNDIA